MKATTLRVSIMLLLAVTTLHAQTDSRMSMEIFRGLEFRSIGPSLTTGRISDLEIDPNNPNVWYLTVGSGGLWKTVNRGNTWVPIFDEYPSYSLGAVVVDPKDSDTVWLGTGENTHNRSTSWGDGVYKSTDAGATWDQVGLADSQKIQKILIDPRDSEVVYVAAPGPLWNPGGDRGLFKTSDGGETWQRVLHVSNDTGITDAAFKPDNPDVIYAAAYQRRRRNAMTIAGGPEAGIFRSTDAGASWERIENGLPEVEKGRIALGVDARNPARIYAMVVARGNAGGFFLSDNTGDSWARMSDYSGGDPQYYGEIFVDPHHPDTIWNVEVPIMRSTDKGTTWERMAFDMHVDHHEIVFDATDPSHMWVGNDGGLYETYDAGATWRHFTNLPLSQFYRISADDSRPFYRVCGGAQDNGTICGPSRTMNSAGIRTSDWYRVGGGDGFQSYFDPYDNEIVYAQSQNGALTRLNLNTGQRIGIRPTGNQGGAQERGRWHWDSPLLISKHSPGRIYYGGHRLYRSDDRGDNWVPVSGDLTRNLDRKELPIMGKVWDEDAVGLHLYTTTMSVITTLDESSLVEGLLYTGSDDGLFHVSEDGGNNWTRLESIPGLPDSSYVTDVFASVRNSEVVFATFNNWQNGDFRPWVMRSDDRGRNWVNISGDLPKRSGTWSVVQDHVADDLLFVGTEFGVYFTIDGGNHWTELRGGIPKIQARDLHIQRQWNDLVVGTFGRGVYILDDYSALRHVNENRLSDPAWLFPLRPAPMYAELNQVRPVWGDQTEANPSFGAVLTYHINETVSGNQRFVIMIADTDTNHIRYLDLPDTAGLQRVTWNLRHDPPAGAQGGNRQPGTLVDTGRYTGTIGMLEGDAFIAYGEPQTILVVPLQR